MLLIVRPAFGDSLGLAVPLALRIVPSALLILALGILHDVEKIEPWHKFIGEIAAACLVYWAGIRIQGPNGFNLGAWSFPLTIVWIMACSRAIKSIGNNSGSVLGIGLLSACTMFLAALLNNDIPFAVVALGLGASTCGFLVANLRSSKIQLGESGGMLVGFLVGCGGILWTQKATTALEMTGPVLLLSFPIADMMLAFLRRHLVVANAGHLHDRSLDHWFLPFPRSSIVYLGCAIGAVASLLIAGTRGPGLLIVISCIALSIRILKPAYCEFSVGWRMFREGFFHNALVAQIEVHPLENRLADAHTPADWWAIVESSLDEFGFQQAHISIGGVTYEWCRDRLSLSTWDIELPIADSDFVRLSRGFAATGAAAFAPFTAVLRRSLTSKRSMFLRHNVASDPLCDERGY